MKYRVIAGVAWGILSCGLMSGFDVPQQQEKVPPNFKNRCFVDPAPVPQPDAQEQTRGFRIFSRPLTAPIYPGTRPQNFEKITALRSFGAPGQYVNLNFAVYPFRQLNQLDVKDSGGPGNRELRRVVYWKVKFPHYTTKDGYRRNPEYLFPQDQPFTAVKGEPQRFLLTVKLPSDAAPGMIKGALTVATSELQTPVVIPYEIQVLPFKLKRDPNKHFSSYSYSITRSPRHEITRKFLKDPAWQKRATVNHYRKMVEYGFTFPPFMYLRYDRRNGGRYEIRDFDDLILPALKEAGMPIPFMVLGSCGIYGLYRDYTGERLKHHMRYTVEPPEELYQKMERMLRQFVAEAKAKNYPPIIFAPIDEPSVQSVKMVRRIYQIFKKLGLKTYVTSCPAEELFDDVIDYWSDQPFRDLSEVLSRKKAAYWCYPNHNSYEIKDSAVMCRGGRMTYGFGMWKSHYNVMIPWIWQNEYMAHLGRRSGGGNLLWQDGNSYVTTYWECFREGIIDGQYIYTLNDAIIRREPATDPKLKELLIQGRKLLQDIWNAIPVSRKYLADGHFTDAEFDGYRAALAEMIGKICAYPERNAQVAPSLVLNSTASTCSRENFNAFLEQEKVQNNLNSYTLNFKKFRKYEDEAALDNSTPGVMRFRAQIDLKRDGTGNHNKYLAGWPRWRYYFPEKVLNFNDYDFLTFRMKVQSNRDGETAIRWPLRLNIHSKINPLGSSVLLFDRVEPGEWKTYIFPIDQMRREWKQDRRGVSQVTWLQYWIGESNFHHGDDLNFYFKDMALVGLRHPMLYHARVPRRIAQKDGILPWQVSVLGQLKKPLEVEVVLRKVAGIFSRGVCYRKTLTISSKDFNGAIDLRELEPGNYVLEFEHVAGEEPGFWSDLGNFFTLDFDAMGARRHRVSCPVEIVQL